MPTVTEQVALRQGQALRPPWCPPGPAPTGSRHCHCLQGIHLSAAVSYPGWGPALLVFVSQLLAKDKGVGERMGTKGNEGLK